MKYDTIYIFFDGVCFLNLPQESLYRTFPAFFSTNPSWQIAKVLASWFGSAIPSFWRWKSRETSGRNAAGCWRRILENSAEIENTPEWPREKMENSYYVMRALILLNLRYTEFEFNWLVLKPNVWGSMVFHFKFRVVHYRVSQGVANLLAWFTGIC